MTRAFCKRAPPSGRRKGTDMTRTLDSSVERPPRTTERGWCFLPTIFRREPRDCLHESRKKGSKSELHWVLRLKSGHTKRVALGWEGRSAGPAYPKATIFPLCIIERAGKERRFRPVYHTPLKSECPLCYTNLQCSFTGGSLRWPAMSVFLILRLSSTERPLSHSVATLLEAIADPHPNVLNFDSVITPFSSTFDHNGSGNGTSGNGRSGIVNNKKQPR